MTDLDAYEKKYCRPGRPTARMVFYRDEWIWEDLSYQDAVIREIESQEMNAVCVFTNGMPIKEAGMPPLREVLRRCFTHDGTPAVNVILCAMKFAMTSSGSITIPELMELFVPILEAYTLIAPYKEWKASLSGLSDMEVSISVSLPEFDGIIHGVSIATKHIEADSAALIREGTPKEEAWRTAAYRVFGDAPARTAQEWRRSSKQRTGTPSTTSPACSSAGAHAYGGDTRGRYIPEQFGKRLSVMDVTIKNEDNHETNMLSSDDYNAYHGGMIVAVRSLRGKTPRSYTGDSTDRSRPVMRSVAEEMKRVFRSETVNPKYIHGMMEHGCKGAADMANMTAHCFQWDATSAVMDDWMYENLTEKYTPDQEVRQWMERVNPWALSRIAETLLEADQRQLWKAKLETKEALQKLYLDIEGELEAGGDDDEKEE